MPFTFTHSLVGYIIGTFLGKKLDPKNLRRYQLVGLIAGMLPDLDGILIGINYPLHKLLHRAVFHPLVFAFLTGFLIAFLAQRYWKLDFWKTALVAILGFSTHILFDLILTDSSIPVFAPFSQVRFSFPFAVDPWYWGDLLVASLFLLYAYFVILQKPLLMESTLSQS